MTNGDIKVPSSSSMDTGGELPSSQAITAPPIWYFLPSIVRFPISAPVITKGGVTVVSYWAPEGLKIVPGTRESPDSFSAENAINARRLRAYRADLTDGFLTALRESEFEFGYDSLADTFVRREMKNNSLAIKEWLNALFISNFHDSLVVAGILRVVAHLDYLDIAPQGPTMALAALSHASADIQELGIRAFENWANKDSLAALEHVAVNEGWLQDYLHQVLKDLRAQQLA